MTSVFSFVRQAALISIAVLLFFSSPVQAFFGGKSITSLTPVNREVYIKRTDITPEASFFSITEDSTDIIFFLVRDAQGGIRLALDACDVCKREGGGYTQKGGNFVCGKCGMEFPLNRIGLYNGGCNPHPVPFTERGGDVVIRVDDLRRGLDFFR